MGMFDQIKVEFPLPDKEVQNEIFQTKDLDPCIMTYFITKEGRLLFIPGVLWNEEEPRIEDATEPPIDTEYHGYIRFYTYIDHIKYEYRAKFTDGTLVKIERVTDDEKTPELGFGKRMWGEYGLVPPMEISPHMIEWINGLKKEKGVNPDS